MGVLPLVRDELILSLERTLVGPLEGPEERFVEAPDRRYVSGILYPRNLEVGEAEDSNDVDEGDGDGGEGTPSARISLISELKPSSMGLSFLVDGAATSLDIDVRWATYQRVEKDPEGKGQWGRKEWSDRLKVPLPLTGARWDKTLASSGSEGPKPEITVMRSPLRGPGQILSVFFTNRQSTAEEREAVNLRCIFSPIIRLVAAEGGFLARPIADSSVHEEDLASLRLLYRDRGEFATGHGCSVMWDEVEGDRCGVIVTTFVPRYHQPRFLFHESGDRFSIGDFGERRNLSQTQGLLQDLVTEYDTWVTTTFNPEVQSRLEGDLREAFLRHRADCELLAQRMRDGLELLRRDSRVQDAFLFMNQAMYVQRIHAEEAEKVKRDSPHEYTEPRPDDPASRGSVKWRAFQIAFILETIPDLVEPQSAHRRDVDLLWVGTGSGKTEAYLGIVAFSLAFRRLSRTPEVLRSGGVNVLMRYTLRLLTIQQFQRAAALLCACEWIRMANPAKWGNSSNPFLVGLFVGQGTTPNRVGSASDVRNALLGDGDEGFSQRTAYQALLEYQETGRIGEGSSPFQLSHCPWCGARLTTQSYRIDPMLGLTTRCVRERCFFRGHDIPVLTVDEDIRHRLPSLVIGTVDKFAQLPFNPNLTALFGHARARCKDHGFIGRNENHSQSHGGGPVVQDMVQPLPAPDVIIQDEPHLLNGPLGSMMGIYETVVDFLCSRVVNSEDCRPKIIASTATIRRAADQVRGIFVRQVRRFPPPGAVIEDSFFIREDSDMSRDKLYVGVIPSGIGQKTLLKKSLSTLLRSVKAARDAGVPPVDWDPYWTVVAYFNSIRELGTAKTTIEDDVNNEVAASRTILPVSELTSNLDSSKLPQILEDLFRPGTDPKSIGILACSNMFSVGVDVPRLGLMVVNSQPKGTSEYVQATGRIGRSGGGLVVVLFNWTRPRDQSHFERFFDYHQRIQSHVEAITVTPFSDGARQRALHAVYIALARSLGPQDLCNNNGAEAFSTAIRSSASCQRVEQEILHRAGRVSALTANDAGGDLRTFLDEWIQSSRLGRDLRYHSYRTQLTDWLVMVSSPEETDVHDAGPRRLTPGSLRNVESEVLITKVH